MPIRSKPRSKKVTSPKFILGRERFTKISAVEGIALTPAMKKRAKTFSSKGLTAAERRMEIIKAHSKG